MADRPRTIARRRYIVRRAAAVMRGLPGAVGGIAARVAGAKVFGIKTDKAASHAEDLKSGPRWAQGTADEGRADPVDHSGRAAGGILRRSWRSCRRMHRRWGGILRSPPHGRESSGRTGSRGFQDLRPGGRVPPPASARYIARPCPTGVEVACKLQYPDMPSTVDADLQAIEAGDAASTSGSTSVIEGDEIYAEIADRLREELDYLNARRAQTDASTTIMLRDRARWSVCRSAGAGADHQAVADDELAERHPDPAMDRQQTRRMEARNDTRQGAVPSAWYVPFYRFGVIHGDPHLGNYQVRGGQQAEPTRPRRDPGVPAVKFITGVIHLL